jgi:hypothetical protein
MKSTIKFVEASGKFIGQEKRAINKNKFNEVKKKKI